VFDVRELSGVTDYYMVVTGSSAPHVKALQEAVAVALKHEGMPCYRKAGNPDGGWVVIDYVDVVIHVLSRSAREYYDLETLWDQAPRVA
jgi:ribosome-associated protein